MLLRFNEFQINEGKSTDVVKLSVDFIYAFRLVKILYQPWESTEAFKLGLIDSNGKKIRSPSSLQERAAYSPFISLVFNVKRLLGKVPGGDSRIAGLAASYMMMKEYAVYNDGILPEAIDEVVGATFIDWGVLAEDTPVMTASAVPSQPRPMLLKRKDLKIMRRYEGKHTFEVESDLFDRIKSAKLTGESWDKFIKDTDGKIGEEILQYKKSHPNESIVLKRKNMEVYNTIEG